MTAASRRIAMVCFDRETNEVVMQAENVEVRPVPRLDGDLDDFRPWDGYPRPVYQPSPGALFLFHFDESAGYAVRRIFTRAEQEELKKRLNNGVG
ncbi:hypothetical protein SEA_SPEEDDEMON_80 [Gordonia phage SpeedDemon]|nr:hypothetical protein SEA_SPEEDDEMON_80 [Gordonia phage SpeedDemon]